MKIFFSLSLEAHANKLRCVIESVLAKHNIPLHALNWNSLRHLADLMYKANFISSDIQQSPSLDNIMTQLKIELSSRGTISQIEEYCTKYLLILTDMGGSCAQVSETLQQYWIKNSRAECGVELQLGM